MKTEIAPIPSDLVNKIAAGEVIERPASVVKELIENAIDADATRITVTIRDGGRKLIQVADNGFGMTPEQLEVAIQRHTTSKIRKFEDLLTLDSMGFRGEALASICSVARVSIVSAVADAPAAEIIVDSGVILERRAAARNTGTTVSVKFLFHQVPARLKFLRTPETEAGHITDVVARLALAHPHVHFELTQDDREVLNIPVQTDDKARIASIIGSKVSEQIYYFQGETEGMQVQGWLGHPQMARSQRGSTHFFINGRAVYDKTLWHATQEAYRDLLMKGKYPVMVMYLSINPAEIDVNVHPAKEEVRFAQTRPVHTFVYQVVREKLRQAPWLEESLSRFAGDVTQKDLAAGPLAPSSSSLAPQGRGDPGSVLPVGVDHYSNLEHAPSVGTNHYSPSSNTDGFTKYSGVSNSNGKPENASLPVVAIPEFGTQKNIAFGSTPYADLQPIGQLLGTYIICEGNGKLVLIDQHAAHERIGFEKLLIEFNQNGVKSAALLIPETFDLRPSDAAILKNYLDELGKYGFELEFFGGNTFVLKAVPVLLQGKLAISDLIQDVLDDIREKGELVALKDHWHHVLATMSCHAQIRAHHLLTSEEIRALLVDLERYQFTDFCPHGRPVAVEVTLSEIEKWFKRVL